MPKSVDTDATNHYAGPFCGCGDYSCPANDDTNAECVNNDRGSDAGPTCRCMESDCAVRHGTGPCTYPPQHPIHH